MFKHKIFNLILQLFCVINSTEGIIDLSQKKAMASSMKYLNIPDRNRFEHGYEIFGVLKITLLCFLWIYFSLFIFRLPRSEKAFFFPLFKIL